MFRSLLLAASLAATLSLPQAARAAFMDNFPTWTAVPREYRLGFVAGAIDRMIQGDDGGTTADFGRALGIMECIRDPIRRSPSLFEDVLTETYKADHELWAASPVRVLEYVMVRMCGREMNHFLAKMGEPLVNGDAALAKLKAHLKAVAENNAAIRERRRREAAARAP